MNFHFEPHFCAGTHHCVFKGLSPHAWPWAVTSPATGIPPLPSTALCLGGASPSSQIMQLHFSVHSASNTSTSLLFLARWGMEKVAYNNFAWHSQEASLLQILRSTSYLRWIHLILPRYQVGSNVLSPRVKKTTLVTSSFKMLTYQQEDFQVCVCVSISAEQQKHTHWTGRYLTVHCIATSAFFLIKKSST